jgi:hypothetical protein
MKNFIVAEFPTLLKERELSKAAAELSESFPFWDSNGAVM